MERTKQQHCRKLIRWPWVALRRRSTTSFASSVTGICKDKLAGITAIGVLKSFLKEVIVASGHVKHEDFVEQVKKMFTQLLSDPTTASHLLCLQPDCLDDLAYSIMYEISSLCYQVSDEDVTRARNQLKSLLLLHIDGTSTGLLKSEEILEGAAMLRLSNDIEFEEQTFMAMMNEAREKWSKLRVPKPIIPMEIRAEKALDAIYVCCFGSDHIEEEDQRLLNIMIGIIFPMVGKPEVERIVKGKAKLIAEVVEDSS